MRLAENLIKKLIFMATWQPNELLCKIIQRPHQGEHPSPSHSAKKAASPKAGQSLLRRGKGEY